MFADKAFFSYLDPLFFIAIIIFSEKFIEKAKNSFFSIYLFLYFLILHLSWIYYFEIHLDGIIR